jgi:hypothetical protein
LVNTTETLQQINTVKKKKRKETKQNNTTQHKKGIATYALWRVGFINRNNNAEELAPIN